MPTTNLYVVDLAVLARPGRHRRIRVAAFDEGHARRQCRELYPFHLVKKIRNSVRNSAQKREAA